MTTPTVKTQNAQSSDEHAVGALYHRLLDCWNRRDAEAFAALFAENGNSVGFDGSPLNGQAEIAESLHQIFADHVTANYVGKIREVRLLDSQVALVRAVCGMVPRGQVDLNPAANAMQTLVAVRHDDGWRIALFQNTPAQFHGRPEVAEALTQELHQLL